MTSNPLVTIGIVAYNSATTILETLDSVASQTYCNIELIVSDDGSQDKTVEIARRWLSVHKDRFVRTELLTVKQNTGIAPNFNRLLQKVNGEFLKPIAADDILMSTCIENNMQYIGDNDMLVSDVERFNKDVVLESASHIKFNKIFSLPSKERAHYYARTSFFRNVPTLFLRMSLYDKVGMYDEEEPLLEDVPFLLRVFASDAKIKHFSEVTVRYRMNGISNSNSTKFERILLHAFFTYNINYLNKSNLLDNIKICERKFYRWILGDKPVKDFVLCLYSSKWNVFNRMLRKFLYRI